MPEPSTLFCHRMTGKKLDEMLAGGWRHFGPLFFRETRGWNDQVGRMNRIFPLRVEVDRFLPGRTWSKLLRRTDSWTVSIDPAVITDEHRGLFDRHITRFRKNVPDAPEVFLGDQPHVLPHPIHALSLRRGTDLIAVGFLDRTPASTSAIYTMWDPAESRFSPGVLVLLHAIAWTRSLGLRHLYTGYDFEEESVYSYKHRFAGTQWRDDDGGWKDWPPDDGGTRP